MDATRSILSAADVGGGMVGNCNLGVVCLLVAVERPLDGEGCVHEISWAKAGGKSDVVAGVPALEIRAG